jgi:hypothetical protein
VVVVNRQNGLINKRLKGIKNWLQPHLCFIAGYQVAEVVAFNQSQLYLESDEL